MNRRTALAFSPGAAGPLLADEEPWQERALCTQTDPDAFFPELGESSGPAKRVCRACDVRAECLAYALATDQRYGIWGGMSRRDRLRVMRQRATLAAAA